MMLTHPITSYLLLNGDSLHKGTTAIEIVESMRQAMFTVPESIQAYMEGVRDRAIIVNLGQIDASSPDSFLASLVQLDLAEWLTESVVRERFGTVLVERKKLSWDWVLQRKKG